MKEIFDNKESSKNSFAQALSELFKDKGEEVVRKILNGKLFLDDRFYELYSGNNASKLPFYNYIKPHISQWSVLYQLWYEIIIEIETHRHFLEELSAKELIYYFGAYAEILNAERKTQKENPEFARQQETDRQGYNAALVGITINKILADYLPDKNFMEDNCELKPFTIETFNEVDSIVDTYNKFDHVDTAINHYIYENWQVTSDDTVNVKVAPADQKAVSYLWEQKKILYKAKCDLQYRQNFVHTLLSAPLLISNTDFRKNIYNTFSGYDANENSISVNNDNIKELCNETDLNFQYEYLTELVLFSNYNLTREVKDLTIELKDKTILNISQLLKIGIVFKYISQLYVHQIDVELKRRQKHYFKKLHEENDIYRFHNNCMNFLTKSDKKAEYNYQSKLDKNDREKLNQLIGEAKGKAFSSVGLDKTIISFNKEELIHLILKGLKVERGTVDLFISLLSSGISSGVNLTFQPILPIGNSICWYPNSFAYVSVAEMIYESLLKTNKIELHNIQSQISEKNLSELLKNAGFKIIKEDADREFCDSNDIKGDFDALAYKNGTLLHFELKQTHIRNEYGKKNIFKKHLTEKADDQIPRIQRYIETYKEKGQERKGKKSKSIKEILQLKDKEEIEIIKSYLISNSFDFDRQEFNGFRKINTLELSVLLTDTEVFLYDYDDYLKINIRRIKKAGNPVPVNYLQWINGETSDKDFYRDEKNLKLADKFVKHFRQQYWKNKDNKTIEELIDNLENNRIFDYLDDLKFEPALLDIPIGKYTLQIGSILEK